jgi:hypothetical protein
MAKVIVAIHGLRNKPSKDVLKKWGKLSINEGLQNLNIYIELPEFQMVYWADILYDRPLSEDEKDEKSPYFLDENYTPACKKKRKRKNKYPFRYKTILILKKIIYAIFLKGDYKLRFPFISRKFIHNNFKDLEIYFTEGCDYNYTINCEKRDRINERLASVLKKHKNDDILLIAHSMGSIIAFDVLSFIAPQVNIDTFITIGSPLGAPFVVSRIAKLYKSKHQGHIKLQTPEAVKSRWCNFSDIRDNIAMDYKLSDDFKENSKGVKVEDYIVVNTYKMNGKANPHKSIGYLRTLEFINVLVDFIKK